MRAPSRDVDVLFIQGAGAGAHEEDAALATNLAEQLGEGFSVVYPRMPDEDTFSADRWVGAIAAALGEAEGPVVVVGHSAGGYQLLVSLAERPTRRPVLAVCLIAAPFPGGDADWTLEGFDLPPDLSGRMPDGAQVFLYASEDDKVVPFSHRDLYAAALPGARVRTVHGGHQIGADLAAVAADIRASVVGG